MASEEYDGDNNSDDETEEDFDESEEDDDASDSSGSSDDFGHDPNDPDDFDEDLERQFVELGASHLLALGCLMLIRVGQVPIF